VKYRSYTSLFLGISLVLATASSHASTTLKSKGKAARIKSVLVSHAKLNSKIHGTSRLSIKAERTHTVKHRLIEGKKPSLLSAANTDKPQSGRLRHQILVSNRFTNGSSLQLETPFSQIQPGPSAFAEEDIQTIMADRDNYEFSIGESKRNSTHQFISAQATVESSLYIDGEKAGLSAKLIEQLTNIFAWDIDFASNLHKGDQFTVLYEKKVVDGITTDNDEIVAAEFINQGKSYMAVRYKDQKGHVSYYSPDGGGMRKAFLSTPVDFARVSSHFDAHRKHPVLNRIRAHKGVDYAARTGTPVKSTADGEIVFSGRKGGYGQVVVIKHGERYETLYAHLSKFKKGLTIGSQVKQGEVIGYVGQTGLATGPHLHYEFHVDGNYRNPLTVALPNSLPISTKLLASFKTQTQPLLAQLNQAKSRMLFAKNQSRFN